MYQVILLNYFKLKKILFLVVHVCEDLSLNDCDNPSRAICKEVGYEDYVCKCRDGFYDDSPNIDVKPGRSCKPCQLFIKFQLQSFIFFFLI